MPRREPPPALIFPYFFAKIEESSFFFSKAAVDLLVFDLNNIYKYDNTFV